MKQNFPISQHILERNPFKKIMCFAPNRSHVLCINEAKLSNLPNTSKREIPLKKIMCFAPNRSHVLCINEAKVSNLPNTSKREIPLKRSCALHQIEVKRIILQKKLPLVLANIRHEYDTTYLYPSLSVS